MINFKYSYILSFLLLSSILFSNFFQISFQHWSAIIDNDIQYIFDTILVSSNIDQTMKDHPGFTNYFFFSIIVKSVNLFNHNLIYDLNEIISLKNPNSTIENIFITLRTVNSFFCYFFVIYFYKNLKCFEIKKNLRLLITSILVFSEFFLDALFRMNSDITACLFFLVSNYYLITYFKKNKNYRIFLSGFFLIFSLLSKILIVFNFFYSYLVFVYFMNKKKINNHFFLNNSKFYFGIILILYFIFQLSLNLYDEKFRYIDITIFSVYVVIFFIFIKKILKFEAKQIYTIQTIFTFIIAGAIFSIFLFIFLSEIGLVKFSLKNLLRVSNPFHYLTIYSSTNNLSSSGEFFLLSIMKNLIDAKSEFINTNFYLDHILLLTCLFILIFFRAKSDLKNNSIYIYITFLYIVFMILIMKLRNIENVLVGQNLGYYFYFKPTLLILIGFLITKLNFKKFAHLFLTSFLVLTTINSLIFFKGYYPYQDNPKKDFLSIFNRSMGFNSSDCKKLSDPSYVLKNRYNNYLLRSTPYNDHLFYKKLCQDLKLN